MFLIKIFEFLKGNYLKFIFYSYIIFILKIILFKSDISKTFETLSYFDYSDITFSNSNFIPLDTIIFFYRAYLYSTINTQVIFDNIFWNIIIFIPFWFLFAIISKKYWNLFFTILITFIFVFIIESIQLITDIWYFDVDDIILNVLWAILWYVLYSILKRIYLLFIKK